MIVAPRNVKNNSISSRLRKRNTVEREFQFYGTFQFEDSSFPFDRAFASRTRPFVSSKFSTSKDGLSKEAGKATNDEWNGNEKTRRSGIGRVGKRERERDESGMERL